MRCNPERARHRLAMPSLFISASNVYSYTEGPLNSLKQAPRDDTARASIGHQTENLCLDWRPVEGRRCREGGLKPAIRTGDRVSMWAVGGYSNKHANLSERRKEGRSAGTLLSLRWPMAAYSTSLLTATGKRYRGIPQILQGRPLRLQHVIYEGRPRPMSNQAELYIRWLTSSASPYATS